MKGKQMEKIRHKEKILWSLFMVLIFGGMFVFYTRIEPLMVCDPDDWTYISYIRQAYPVWALWNPAKVMPETIMGILGNFAAFVVYPITGDYIYSFTYVYAFVVSAVIAAYIGTFDYVVRRIFKLTFFKSVYASILFFALHFLLFKSRGAYNIFMFSASDLNCFMNYLVPMLICAILGLLFLLNRESMKINGIALLIIYLAIFSNMATNIVFLAPVIVCFLYDFWQCCRKRSRISVFFKEHKLYIYIFVLEIINLVFEANGGRAGQLEFDLKKQLMETYGDLISLIRTINFKWASITVLLIAVAVIIAIKNRKNEDTVFHFGVSFFSFVICAVYMILLFTRVGLHKILRSENVAVLFLWYCIFVAFAFAYIIKKLDKVSLIMPIVSYILLIAVFMGDGHAYKGSISYYDYNVKKCYEVNQYVISQFIEADMNGQTEVDLVLERPGLGSYDFTGSRIANTLYKHRIVSRRLDVNIIVKDKTE